MEATDFGATAEWALSEGILPETGSWRRIVLLLAERIAEERSTRFALVATNGTVASPLALQRLELVLASGERLEIPSSTDEATLRTVLGLLRERV